MISNQEEDVFVAVRVQDPRMQNEGSWNSYVDYKIFLHTNSKAFTAKTSCVRRRYSEFAWLKKKLQKNAGLVPVPELPGKYFFFLSNEDFLERRRTGLQAFLDNVVNMTVCLSDSQLHLFLQTQLPVGHIQDCVQGHTPYSVTDAILTYASSNRGYAQAQEEDAAKEPSLTVSYESMESPAPHQPKDVFGPELLSRGVSDPPEGSPEICDEDAVELQREENSSLRVVQRNEAIVEDRGPAEATFFLGDGRGDSLESLGLAEPTQQRSCRTSVEVHSPMGAGLLEEACPGREEGVTATDTEEETGPRPDAEEEEDDQRGSSGEAETVDVDSEPENCTNSAAISDFKDRDFEERGTEGAARSQEEVPDGRSGSKAETPLQSETHEEARGALGVPEEEGGGGDLVQQMDRADLDGGGGHSSSNESIVKVSDDESIYDDAEDSIEDSIHKSHEPIHDSIHEPIQDSIQHSIHKSIQDSIEDSIHESQDSIHEPIHEPIQDSIHELIQDSIHESQDSIQDSIHESQDSIQSANGDEKKEVGRWSTNILDLHTNGRSVEKEDLHEDLQEDLHNTTSGGDSSKSLEVNLTVTGEDLTENGDFGIIESSCTAAGKCAEQEDVKVEAH